MSASRSQAAALLLPQYLANRERELVAIRRALELKDFPTLARIGHNLRGNARSYGFPELAVLGEVLEGAAKARRADKIDAPLRSLEEWLALNRQVADDGNQRALAASGTGLRAAAPLDPTKRDDDAGGTRTPPDGK